MSYSESTDSNMKIERLKYVLLLTLMVAGCAFVILLTLCFLDLLQNVKTGRSFVVEPVLRLIIGG